MTFLLSCLALRLYLFLATPSRLFEIAISLVSHYGYGPLKPIHLASVFGLFFHAHSTIRLLLVSYYYSGHAKRALSLSTPFSHAVVRIARSAGLSLVVILRVFYSQSLWLTGSPRLKQYLSLRIPCVMEALARWRLPVFPTKQ